MTEASALRQKLTFSHILLLSRTSSAARMRYSPVEHERWIISLPARQMGQKLSFRAKLSRWRGCCRHVHSASCSDRQLILLLSERGRLSTSTTERGVL